MSTAPNAVASIVGSAVGAATTGPLSIVGTIANLGKDLIDRFIPDPAMKLAASQHLIDVQQELALATIDQQNKEMEAASKNIQADPHMSAQRAYFCAGITSMLIFNYAGTPLLHAFLHLDIAPLAIPASVLSIFAVIMLGFVGIPAALNMAQTVAGMSGDSTVKLPFGLGQVGNNSPK